MAENPSGDPNAVGTGAPGEYSVGLWQINIGRGVEGRISQYGWTQAYLSDPVNNARAAIQISGNGASWNDWTTYTGGEYLQYMQGGSVPVAASSGGNFEQPIPFQSGSGCQTWSWNVFGNDICFDAPVGVLAMVGGGVLMLAGVAIIVAFALKETGIGRTATKAVTYSTGPVGRVVAAQQAREDRQRAAKATAERQSREAATESHRAAMRRSQLRISRARARVAESRARSQAPSSRSKPRVITSNDEAREYLKQQGYGGAA